MLQSVASFTSEAYMRGLTLNKTDLLSPHLPLIYKVAFFKHDPLVLAVLWTQTSLICPLYNQLLKTSFSCDVLTITLWKLNFFTGCLCYPATYCLQVLPCTFNFPLPDQLISMGQWSLAGHPAAMFLCILLNSLVLLSSWYLWAQRKTNTLNQQKQLLPANSL